MKVNNKQNIQILTIENHSNSTSPFGIIVGMAIFFITFGGVLYIYGYTSGFILLSLGLVMLCYLSSSWLMDKDTFTKEHRERVPKSCNLGFTLFVLVLTIFFTSIFIIGLKINTSTIWECVLTLFSLFFHVFITILYWTVYTFFLKIHINEIIWFFQVYKLQYNISCTLQDNPIKFLFIGLSFICGLAPHQALCDGTPPPAKRPRLDSGGGGPAVPPVEGQPQVEEGPGVLDQPQPAEVPEGVVDQPQEAQPGFETPQGNVQQLQIAEAQAEAAPEGVVDQHFVGVLEPVPVPQVPVVNQEQEPAGGVLVGAQDVPEAHPLGVVVPPDNNVPPQALITPPAHPPWECPGAPAPGFNGYI